MNETTELIYIGDHFYFQSGTAMSSLYTINGSRYDWGFVQRDLSRGKSINIRPATSAEIAIFEGRLKQIKGEYEQL